MHILVCVFVCIWACVHVCVCACGNEWYVCGRIRVCGYLHVGMCVHSHVYVCVLACMCACVLAIVMITACIVNRPTPTVQSSSEGDCSVKSLTLEW